MHFYCYDNIYTYNKRIPYDKDINTRLYINTIQIPETGAFWFETDYVKEERNVNIHKPYVHFHPGMVHGKNIQFDNEPYNVKMTEITYNPITHSIEIKKPKSFFRKEKLFSKKCTYYGSKHPKKPITVLGEIIYNMNENSINFILNYFPQYKRKITFENEPEPPTFEQISRVEELEHQIKQAEEKLKERSLSVQMNSSQ